MDATNDASAVKPVPDGYLAVTPWAIVDDAAAFLDFLAGVFEAQEVIRLPASDGTIGHAETRINGGPIMVFDRRPEWFPTPAFLRVYVDDVDAVLARGERAGALLVTLPTTEWFGDRFARMRDPWDNLWWVHPRVFEPTREQLVAGPADDGPTRQRNEIVASTLDVELRRRAQARAERAPPLPLAEALRTRPVTTPAHAEHAVVRSACVGLDDAISPRAPGSTQSVAPPVESPKQELRARHEPKHSTTKPCAPTTGAGLEHRPNGGDAGNLLEPQGWREPGAGADRRRSEVADT